MPPLPPLGAPPLPVLVAPPAELVLPPWPMCGPVESPPPLELEQAATYAKRRIGAVEKASFVMPMRKRVEDRTLTTQYRVNPLRLPHAGAPPRKIARSDAPIPLYLAFSRLLGSACKKLPDLRIRIAGGETIQFLVQHRGDRAPAQRGTNGLLTNVAIALLAQRIADRVDQDRRCVAVAHCLECSEPDVWVRVPSQDEGDVLVG